MFACADTPCRVLIADDVPDIRSMMRFWLDTGDREFEVVGEAADGFEAVEEARTKKPHAVILDLSMPRMDGLQAIPEIRKHSPDTKILVLSGFDADALSRKALQLGADAYLEKGASFTELAEVLRGLCPDS
jgi:YesN/AraC family two-component response regulator